MENIQQSAEDGKFQVFVVNIHWNKSRPVRSVKSGEVDSLQDSIVLDIPEAVLKNARKKGNSFEDVIEQFVYRILTNKFGFEIWNCQIWLPLDQ